MEYINTFLNLSAFTEAKPNLPNPSLSLIENTNQVYYIKKQLIKVTLNMSEEYSNKELPLGGFEYNRKGSAVDEIINSINQVVFPKELCEDVIIDGVSVGPINTYTFTAGKHIVEYAMKDETKVVDTQFFDFDILGIESVEIPDSVTSIGDNAFVGCSGLTAFKLPIDITSIGYGAFAGCSGLKTVDLTSYSKLTSIGDGAFAGCTGLTSITIPDSVTSIGSEAFTDCTGLTAFKLPIDITSIGSGAFAGCSGLKTVDLTSYSKLTSIGDSAFKDCTGLTSITIPERITLIGSYTFDSCSSLTEVTYKGKIYTSKRELLNDLRSNNVETGSYAFDNTGLGV